MPKRLTRSSKTPQTEIILGDTYVDLTHGFEGVCTSYTMFLTGCDRVCLSRLVEGDLKELGFDVTQIKRKDDEPVVVEKKRPGGPGDVVSKPALGRKTNA